MSEREFFGITQNECTLQGKVLGDPVINGENYAFLWLRLAITEQDANGQWTDIGMNVPVMTQDPRKVSTIAKYVKDGRELLIYSYYKAWEVNGQPGHAFIIKKMVLGRKKFIPQDSGPELPGN